MTQHAQHPPEHPIDPYASPWPEGREGLPVDHGRQAPDLAQRFETLSVELLAAVAQLDGFLTGATRPAERRALTFTTTNPSLRDQDARVSPSIGVYNPTGATVYVALGGETPKAGKGCPSVPPNGFAVFPVAVQDLDVGIDPADAALVAAGTAGLTVQLFRYWTVQPLALGKGA